MPIKESDIGTTQRHLSFRCSSCDHETSDYSSKDIKGNLRCPGCFGFLRQIVSEDRFSTQWSSVIQNPKYQPTVWDKLKKVLRCH